MLTRAAAPPRHLNKTTRKPRGGSSCTPLDTVHQSTDADALSRVLSILLEILVLVSTCVPRASEKLLASADREGLVLDAAEKAASPRANDQWTCRPDRDRAAVAGCSTLEDGRGSIRCPCWQDTCRWSLTALDERTGDLLRAIRNESSFCSCENFRRTFECVESDDSILVDHASECPILLWSVVRRGQPVHLCSDSVTMTMIKQWTKSVKGGRWVADKSLMWYEKYCACGHNSVPLQSPQTEPDNSTSGIHDSRMILSDLAN